MTDEHGVSAHYTQGGLIDAISKAIGEAGKSIDAVSVDDLAPVDEFHIGGRQASDDFLGQLSLSPDQHLLDIGCGLGGCARFVADRYGCQVTGIDLTDEFVETGKTLCAWVGLEDRISFQQGSALAMPFEDAAFDGAYMFHVGMNIADKATLFAEAYRVLRPGAEFGIYDVMQTGDGELTFPVPWAMTAENNAAASPAAYKEHLTAAGFTIAAERDRRDFALDFFAQLRAKLHAAGGPPPLGVHILMGRNTPDMVQNMDANITAGRVAPVELIARK